MKFAEKLKKAMQELNLNQRQVVTMTGKSKGSVSQYLSGKQIPSEDVQSAIATSLGLASDYFTGMDKELQVMPQLEIKDHQDRTINKIGEKDGETVSEERWEVQEAWDKQNNFLKAQARAQAELSRMIKQYDEMLHANWELATEEQKTRIQSMKAKAQELLIDLITGRPENEAVKIIANKFDQGIFEARRLVRTEAAFVSGELNAEAYEECDLQKYQFLATLDLRTSEICRSLDGKRFFLKDRQVGKNYPPMHPWCRSTTIAVISEDDIKKLKRRALNPETGRTELVPASMTYEEWYKKYVKDNPKARGQEKAIQNKASDQAQYQKYKKSGIDGVPASFTGFQKLKYQEPEKWELLKKDYRERKKQ